jgi:hypothetical protein
MLKMRLLAFVPPETLDSDVKPEISISGKPWPAGVCPFETYVGEHFAAVRRCLTCFSVAVNDVIR